MVWPGSGEVWIVGCGNMGGALLNRWLDCGLEKSRVTVIDPAPASIQGIAWGAHPPATRPDLILLGVKPQLLDAAAPVLGAASEGAVVVSILAGVECADLAARFPGARAIARAMPNLPARLGKGVTGLFAPTSDRMIRAAIEALFRATGHAEWLDHEDQFHAVTALSGSGPAFVYRFIAAMADAGAKLGLPQDQALRLAEATIEGAAALSAHSADPPDALARQVTSPNGTTAAGLAALDLDGQFVARVAEALSAAARRSAELAAAAKAET